MLTRLERDGFYPLKEEALQAVLTREAKKYREGKQEAEQQKKMVASLVRGRQYQDALALLAEVRASGYWDYELEEIRRRVEQGKSSEKAGFSPREKRRNPEQALTGREGQQGRRIGKVIAVAVVVVLVILVLWRLVDSRSHRPRPKKHHSPAGSIHEDKERHRREAEQAEREREHREAEWLAKEQEQRKAERLEREREQREADRLAKEQEQREAERLAREREQREADRLAKEQEQRKRSADGRYEVSQERVITDTTTGLQWYVGPDRNTNWNEAKSWAENLIVAGGGWRLPSLDELEGIYEKNKGYGNAHIDKVFWGKNTNLWVWSNETKGSWLAWYFYFSFGNRDSCFPAASPTTFGVLRCVLEAGDGSFPSLH